MDREESLLVPYGQINFSFKWNLTSSELNNCGFLINILKKPMTQLTMNLHGCANDGVCLRVPLVYHPHKFLSVKSVQSADCYFFPFLTWSSSTRPKIMRPAAVWRTLVMLTSMYSPMNSLPFSMTTIVPSSM